MPLCARDKHLRFDKLPLSIVVYYNQNPCTVPSLCTLDDMISMTLKFDITWGLEWRGCGIWGQMDVMVRIRLSLLSCHGAGYHCQDWHKGVTVRHHTERIMLWYGASAHSKPNVYKWLMPLSWRRETLEPLLQDESPPWLMVMGTKHADLFVPKAVFWGGDMGSMFKLWD